MLISYRIERYLASLVFVLVLGSLSHRALAQTAPATSPAATMAALPEGELKATITGVEGLVQVRSDENSPWASAKAGMVLGQGAEFRTGPRSAVRFEIPPDQTVTLDRLGVIKLMEAIKSSNKVTTDLGMQYGRVRYDIEAAGLDNDSTLHSPGSALAVRGTKVSLYDQPPFAPQALSLTGRAEFRAGRKGPVAFGGKGKGTARIESGSESPAQTAMVQSVLNSEVLDRTDQQLREMTFLFQHEGRLVTGTVAANYKPVTDAELPSLLSGALDFVLRWNAPRTEDLNIIVRTPTGQTFGNPPFILSLFPNDPRVQQAASNLPTSIPGVGQVGLNSIGPAGFEIATLGSNYPKGVYLVGAYNFLYNDKNVTPTGPKVPFTIEAFLDGKRQLLVVNFAQVLAGTQSPRFGYVYRDAIALGELGTTAVPEPQLPADNPTRPTANPKSTPQAAPQNAKAAPARATRGKS